MKLLIKQFLIDTITKAIQQYLKLISDKYKINIDILQRLMKSNVSKPKKRLTKAKLKSTIERLQLICTVNIIIKRDNKGRYINPETGFVFDNSQSKKVMVVGKVDKNTDDIVQLTKHDIDICKQKKLNYKVPFNMDSVLFVKKKDDNAEFQKLKDKLIFGIQEDEEEIEEEEEEEVES
jgi:hypothetical protein